jgi:carbon-monoxide dehydrogenase large subunit
VASYAASPPARAKIASIEVTAATGMPGVEAVFPGADLIKDDIGTIPTLAIFKRPDGSPMTVPPRRLLAHEIVRFAGEPIAAVVATSRTIAQSAAEAIAIDYEVLLSVSDPIDRSDQAGYAGGLARCTRQHRRRHALSHV